MLKLLIVIHFYTWSEIHFIILAWTFSKKVTKERLELKSSYLIRQLLTKWSNKTYCNVQKEDWGCCCCCCYCCWRRPWRACSKKTLFTQEKKIRFSMTTRVRSRLAYPEDAPFPIYFWFSEIAQGVGQRAYTYLKE